MSESIVPDLDFPARDDCVKKIGRPIAVAGLIVFTAPWQTIDACQPIYSSVLLTRYQPADERAAIKIEEGMLVVWNAGDLNFTLVVKGKEVKPMGASDHVFFNVDGMVLQVQLVLISEFVPDRKEKKLDDTAILTAHRDWESQYLEGLLHSKLKVQTQNAKSSNGSDVMLWQFDMPDGLNADARQQIYLTVVNKEHILMLNSVASPSVPSKRPASPCRTPWQP